MPLQLSPDLPPDEVFSAYATLTSVHSSTKTKCDYLNGWINTKRSHTQKISARLMAPEI